MEISMPGIKENGALADKMNEKAGVRKLEKSVPEDMAKQEKTRKACADFEALMLQKLLKAMRESVPDGGLVESGYAKEMYEAMHDEGLAKHLAAGKGMGFGEVLFKQLTGQTRPTTTGSFQK